MTLGTQELTQEKIKQRAEEKGISEDEARTELEAEVRSALETRAQAEGKTVEELIAEEEELSGLVNKYEGDPVKMAKALKSSAQEVTKIIERQKILEKELEQTKSQISGQSGKRDAEQVRQEMIADLKRKRPTLEDDVVETIIDERITTLQTAQSFYYADKANDRVEIEKKELEDEGKYPFYKRFKKEIDDLIDGQPTQAKMSKGIVKRCYDNVIGSHASELIKEAKGKPPKDPDTEVNVVKGPNRGKPPIQQPKSGTLLPKQAAEMERMGLSKIESYLSLLKNHKDRAKKEGLPEPELLSDPYYKK